MLRTNYSLIRILTAQGEPKDEATLGLIRKLKQDIRRQLKKGVADGRRIVKDDGIDGYIELITLPGFIKSMESAEEYFENEIRIEPCYSIYDCTGKPFTSWEKIFERNGRFMAYHRVCFDV